MHDTDKPSLTIHRYSSRKFYNKDTKEFVTLDDISRLIRAGHSVTILDKKTGEDITNQYLLTIISEFEGQGEQVIPKDFLNEIIKGYSDAATQVWPKAIEQMMKTYQKNQQDIWPRHLVRYHLTRPILIKTLTRLEACRRCNRK